MIRQLIIPGLIAAAAHAALLIDPHTPEVRPATTEVVLEEWTPPLLPPVPLVENKPDDKPVDIPDIKVPVVFETIATKVDSLFIVEFNPVIVPPNFTGGDLKMIPPGDYVEASRRGVGKGVQELFTRDMLENNPRTLFQGAPEYPYAQKAAGNPGEVVVTFTVDESGNVQDVRVVRSTHVDFEAPTVRAVSRWRFEPGRKDGRRVRFRMSVPVAFSLNEEN